MFALIAFALLLAAVGMVGMIFPQTDYSDIPSIGLEGGRVEYDGASRPRSGLAEGAIRYGVPVVRGTATRGVRALATTDILAADADAWVTAAGSGALGAGAIIIQAGGAIGFDGVQGETPLVISRRGVLVTNAHADWDAGSDMTLQYVSDNGAIVIDTFDKADATAETFRTSQPMLQPIRLDIGAGSGANRTITLGWEASPTSIGSIHALGIAYRDETVIQATTPVGYNDGDTVTYTEDGGEVLVLVEDAVVEGQQVFIRLNTPAGAEYVGQARNDMDVADCFALYGAKYRATGAAGTLVPVKYRPNA